MTVGRFPATLTALALAILGVACSGDDDVDVAERTTTTPTATQGASGGGGALSDLELRLELDDTTLAPGEATGGDLVIENTSTNTIVDRNCALVSIEFGLVPADQPDAPLPGAVEAECEPGGYSIAPGATTRSDASASFTASEPGDYLAIIRTHGGNGLPLIVPVTVTAD